MSRKIKAFLVDDEPDSIDVLSILLQKYSDAIEIIGFANTTENAFEDITKLKPDLVFLDIQMPKTDGLSLLKKFTIIDFEIVFVTSYNQYAIQAIKNNALDYLLKPIDIQELKVTIEKATTRISQKQTTQKQILSLIEILETDKDSKKISVHKGEHVVLVSISDIQYIQANGRYCTIYTHNNENYIISKYLKDFEDYFMQIDYFVRINKSVMLNTNFIIEYSKYLPYSVTLIGGKTFEIPRRKKTEILEQLKKTI